MVYLLVLKWSLDGITTSIILLISSFKAQILFFFVLSFSKRFSSYCLLNYIMCDSAVVSLSELDLPFKDTLNWTKFSVIVTRNEEILQYIVKDIDNQTFTKLHNNLVKVNNAPTSSPTERTSWFFFLIWSTSFYILHYVLLYKCWFLSH